MIQRDETWKALEPLVRRVSRSTALTVVSGGGGNGILLTHAGAFTLYDNTDAGLAAAIAAAASSDHIWLPAGPASGAYTASTTVPAGVTLTGMSRGETVISGKVTLGAGSAIENLSVMRTANDANDLTGVEGGSSGTGKVINCSVSCTQSGAGDAFGVRIGGGGTVEVWNSDLAGASTSGAGYGGGIDGGAGSLIQIGGSAVGSTTPYLEPA